MAVVAIEISIIVEWGLIAKKHPVETHVIFFQSLQSPPTKLNAYPFLIISQSLMSFNVVRVKVIRP